MKKGGFTMRKLFLALTICFWTLSAFAGDADGRKIEQDLQRLSWKQFRSVVESIPKLKADIEAYGPLGWQYVQKNYQTHGWRKNVAKLDEVQKRRLVELIAVARRQKAM
jgi:hypothetical protein